MAPVVDLAPQAQARINDHYRWQRLNRRITAERALDFARQLYVDAVEIARRDAAGDRRPSQSPHLDVVEGKAGVPSDLRHALSRGGHFHLFYLRRGPQSIRVVAAIPSRCDVPSRLAEDLRREAVSRNE